jgi:hypothetical protein
MDKQLLCDLYWKKKLSMMQIAQQCQTTHPRVYYWFKKYGIHRRSWCESAYVKQNPKGDPFYIRRDLSTRERELLLACLMLYWGEGHKTNRYSVQIANLDFRILQLFVKFLREICGIDENKLKLYVQLFNKFDKDIAKKYWAEKLKIPEHHITVNHHIDKRSKEKHQRSKFGIARIQVHNYKLKAWIDKQLENYLRCFESGQVFHSS